MSGSCLLFLSFFNIKWLWLLSKVTFFALIRKHKDTATNYSRLIQS